jgi:hypothetical protein
MPTEEEIVQFAEQLYKQLIVNFNKQDSPFLLLTQDNATFSQLPGIKSENIRNVLIGLTFVGYCYLPRFYSC